MAKEPFRFGVVILAAGASSRMGRNKLLLPWREETVLGHLLTTWRKLNSTQMALVLDQRNRELQQELLRQALPEKGWIFNPHPEQGMFSSIQCAAHWEKWGEALSWFVVMLGDQPLVQTSTLNRLLEFAAENPECICQPSRQGRARHPVVLPRKYFMQLRETKCVNLKEFLATWEGVRAFCEMDDIGLDIDLDTPQDYERALQLLDAQS